jgi:hypothetical protein
MDAMAGARGSAPTPAGWYPDPLGRYTQRYFDEGWTEFVIDAAGNQGTDPVGGESEAQGPASPLSTNRAARRQTVESLVAIGKYRKPLREGSLGAVNVLGGNWNEYAAVALSAMVLETMLDVDERLERLTDVLERIERKL